MKTKSIIFIAIFLLLFNISIAFAQTTEYPKIRITISDLPKEMFIDNLYYLEFRLDNIGSATAKNIKGAVSSNVNMNYTPNNEINVDQLAAGEGRNLIIGLTPTEIQPNINIEALIESYELEDGTLIQQDNPNFDVFQNIREAEVADIAKELIASENEGRGRDDGQRFWLFLYWPHILFALIVIIGSIIAYRRHVEAQKKYHHIAIDPYLLPHPGPRAAYVGKIAETNTRAFLDFEKMTTHTIIAGATGGGKTVAAQSIIEEALDHNIAVVVFDPTGQWSGFLRPCKDRRMFRLYSNFGMHKKDAKAYKGNMFTINDPREYIDLKSKIKPGKINICLINKIDPKDLDIFVANTVRQVFKMNLPEAGELKVMFVYDEVHRLLPKFGGSGAGFIQIERACREFRKWGIGVLLISQVLSDFVGEIKANINTEVQMRTRAEGDLGRIKSKYGDAILKSLVKASQGTGMLQNAEYNKGRPYLVAFRPLKHSVTRLVDKELNSYDKYNKALSDIGFQLEQLKELKQDVFDLELEIKLATDKMMEGKFTMVDIYLDGLKTKLDRMWKKIGKTPKKHEIKLIPEDEIKADIEIAKRERERAVAEMMRVKKSLDSGPPQEKEDKGESKEEGSKEGEGQDKG
ncbi:helicase HerA-like domain-containing protein [Nanoarchaeota archaeon]